MTSEDGRIFLTTAINYTNGEPHIGHLFEGLIGDYYNRFFNLINQDNSYFLTGTDEHGLKIAQKAESLNMTPKELCDQKVELFKQLGNLFEITPNHFIRTTDTNHIETVSKIFTQLYQQDDIYLGTYEGWYSLREEKYMTVREAKLSNFCDTVSGQKFEYINEPSYFFRLSKYQTLIREYIVNQINKYGNQNTDLKNILDKIDSEELQDISITRTKFKWGIPVPLDIDPESKHTIYVWFDALINYITGLELLITDETKRESFQFIHLIGQDIVWFHSVIWIGILLALKHQLPSKIMIHRFVLDENGHKMSKSIGNVIDPLLYVKDNSIEPYVMRSYLLNHAILNNNFKFSTNEMIEHHNNILADQIGNLINRLSSLIDKYSNGILVEIDYLETLQKYPDTNYNLDFINDFINNLLKYVIDENNLQKANLEIINIFHHINNWLTRKEPWKLKGDSQEIILTKNQIVRLALEQFFLGLHFLQLIIPNKTLEMIKGFPINLYPKLSLVVNQFKNNQWLLPNGSKITKQPIVFHKINK